MDCARRIRRVTQRRFVRRSDDSGIVNLLAKTFSVDPQSGVRQLAIDIVRNGCHHFCNLGKSAFEWLNMYHHRSDRPAPLFGSERRI
jgi:hypothetical protein